MEDDLTPSRVRRFFIWLACAFTVYAIMYAGSAAQQKVDLFAGTNAACVGTYNFAASVAEPVIVKIRKA